MTPEDEKLFREIGIGPCDICEPIPHEWTESDIRRATTTVDEVCEEIEELAGIAREKAKALDRAIAVIAAMDKRETQLRSMAAQWKRLAWSALFMASAFLTAAIMLARGVSR